MNPEIEKAIEQLEAKIAELERARDTLVETFCPPDSPRRRMLAWRPASATPGAPANSSEATIPSGGRIRRRLRRKDIVAEFIRQHGPSTRAEILAGAGVPAGSVAFVLNDKARFVLKDGRWHNVGAAQPNARAPSSEAPGAERQEPTAEGPGPGTEGP